MRVVEPKDFKGLKKPKKKRGSRHAVRFGVLFLAVVYVASIFVLPLPGIVASTEAIQPLQPKEVLIKWPAYGQASVGAVGYGMLGTKGEQKALPIASVAKVMTALAVLKQKPLKVGEQGPTITITQEDVTYYDKVVAQFGSNVPVAVGEEITQYQALQALLLPSSNNMAYTLAKWAYGSEKQYTQYVNNFAKSLGMTAAHFEDASGFSPKTVATSEDLARLAVNAMDNPVIAEIVAQTDADIPVAGRIYNVNQLLGKNGIVGIKTGNTEEAGGCFMAAAVRTIAGKKVLAVSAIMGAPTRDQALRDSVPLVNSVLDAFEEVTLVKAGQTVGTYQVPWSGKVAVQAKDNVTGVIWPGTPTKPAVVLDTVRSGTKAIANKMQVGTIQGAFGREEITVPAILAAPIQAPPASWRFKPRFL